MTVNVAAIIFSLIFIGGLLVGGIFLQIFLSKKESVWLGLVLPVITFLFSLVTISLMVLQTTIVTTGETVTEWIDGTAVTEEITEAPPAASGQNANASAAVSGIIVTFLYLNIPTVILLVIYLACRGKQKKLRELEKMSAQDLE